MTGKRRPPNPSFFALRWVVALTSLAFLAQCSGAGCGTCTVPAIHSAPAPLPPGVTPTPLPPGVTPSPTPTPLPPGVTPSPTPTPLPPGVTPSPSPTPVPVVLTCAQNAALGQAIPLGTAATFAVLAGSTVTNVGNTVVTGNLGVSPGTAVTGFGPGVVTGGTIHAGDPAAAQAEADTLTAYNLAVARPLTAAIPPDIGGTVQAPGVYKATTTLAITGNLTLDGQNDPNAVFIFQVPTALTTATNSTVTLIRAANACNVFWAIGTSATLNGTSFDGTVLALASVSFGTGSTLSGRALANVGAVTLLDNAVTVTGP